MELKISRAHFGHQKGWGAYSPHPSPLKKYIVIVHLRNELSSNHSEFDNENLELKIELLVQSEIGSESVEKIVLHNIVATISFFLHV